MSPTTDYCTIIARNYLPKALTLADSVRRHHPTSTLVILLIDVLNDDDLPVVDGARCVSTRALGLSDRQVLDVAASYNLVEFATAIKPLLLRGLLKDSDQVVYLDPDTYVTSPLAELDAELAASDHGIVLTPHYLEQVPQGAHATEGHLLAVGVYNLGFCAVDRRSLAFLDWWWGHLQYQCLSDLLSGLFVDQKWMDVGSTLFKAKSLWHYGYNVSIVNLHERPIEGDGVTYTIRATGEPLRLFHFHAFDTNRPDELSTRFSESNAHLRRDNPAVDLLCKEYAERLIEHERAQSDTPEYVYHHDTTGRRVSRQTRRVFRQQLQAGVPLPSPFLPEDATAFAKWRRRARKQMARDVIGDGAKAFRGAFPDEYRWVEKRFPNLARRVRHRYVNTDGMWG